MKEEGNGPTAQIYGIRSCLNSVLDIDRASVLIAQ
jgi:hypothetical protein